MMPKLSVRISDELMEKIEVIVKAQGLSLSGVVDEALEAYVSRNGEASKSVPPASKPAPPRAPDGSAKTPPPATASDPRVDALIAQVQSLQQQVAARDASLAVALKRIDDLDMRLSRLWSEVHEG